jgi:hypothetical protein
MDRQRAKSALRSRVHESVLSSRGWIVFDTRTDCNTALELEWTPTVEAIFILQNSAFNLGSQDMLSTVV